MKLVVFLLSLIPVIAFANNAVVKISTVNVEYDLFLPEEVKDIYSSSGSGVVIEGGVILTAAHVIDQSKRILVRKAGDNTNYTAEVKFRNDAVDLAILEVMDKTFLKGVRARKIGKNPKMGDEVVVLGYPDGGNMLTQTQGVVSRIDWDLYARSFFPNLVVQVDASINPGNSGGPAFVKNKIAGIAFQGVNELDNVGYVIPASVIQQFIKDTNDGKVDGIPTINIRFQNLENDALKKAFKLPLDQTGILVIKTASKESMNGMVKLNDVLLSMDGHSIGDNGTIKWGADRISVAFLVANKQIGDVIEVGLLRDGKKLTINHTLVNNVQDKYLLPRPGYFKTQPYFEIAGLIFQPLTANYVIQAYDDPVVSHEALFEETQPLGKQQVQRIILTAVYPDEINDGYQTFQNEIVSSVNNIEIYSLDQFKNIVETNKNNGGLLSIKFNDNRLIVIDLSKLKEASKRLKENYDLN